MAKKQQKPQSITDAPTITREYLVDQNTGREIRFDGKNRAARRHLTRAMATQGRRARRVTRRLEREAQLHAKHERWAAQRRERRNRTNPEE